MNLKCDFNVFIFKLDSVKLNYIFLYDTYINIPYILHKYLLINMFLLYIFLMKISNKKPIKLILNYIMFCCLNTSDTNNY